MKNVIDKDRIGRITEDLIPIGAVIALIGMFTTKYIFWIGIILMVPFGIVLVISITMLITEIIWFACKDLWDGLRGKPGKPRNE